MKNAGIEITKVAEKKTLKAGDKNRYTITIKNIGNQDALDVEVEDILIGTVKYIKDTLEITSNNSQNNTLDNIRAIKKTVEWRDYDIANKKSRFNLCIPVIKKEEIYTITYLVEQIDTEKDSITTNNVKAKGVNTRRAEPKDKIEVEVKGVVKEADSNKNKNNDGKNKNNTNGENNGNGKNNGKDNKEDKDLDKNKDKNNQKNKNTNENENHGNGRNNGEDSLNGKNNGRDKGRIGDTDLDREKNKYKNNQKEYDKDIDRDKNNGNRRNNIADDESRKNNNKERKENEILSKILPKAGKKEINIAIYITILVIIILLSSYINNKIRRTNKK